MTKLDDYVAQAKASKGPPEKIKAKPCGCAPGLNPRECAVDLFNNVRLEPEAAAAIMEGESCSCECHDQFTRRANRLRSVGTTPSGMVP